MSCFLSAYKSSSQAIHSRTWNIIGNFVDDEEAEQSKDDFCYSAVLTGKRNNLAFEYMRYELDKQF